jgi:hypothetical protein
MSGRWCPVGHRLSSVGTKEARSVSKPELETTGTTVVCKNRWMTVREDAILRINGTAGIYGVVEKAGFAVGRVRGRGV